MNNSGKSLAPIITSEKKAATLVVLHDDLDLPLGSHKISFGRGSGGHKGVESIIKNIKTRKFIRVRIGISPHTPAGKIKKPSDEEQVLDFIIGKIKPKELDEMKKNIKEVMTIVETIVTEGKEKAMNQFN
jgi:PTH1 family peptidyl-tRNA hydrolase